MTTALAFLFVFGLGVFVGMVREGTRKGGTVDLHARLALYTVEPPRRRAAVRR